MSSPTPASVSDLPPALATRSATAAAQGVDGVGRLGEHATGFERVEGEGDVDVEDGTGLPGAHELEQADDRGVEQVVVVLDEEALRRFSGGCQADDLVVGRGRRLLHDDVATALESVVGGWGVRLRRRGGLDGVWGDDREHRV